MAGRLAGKHSLTCALCLPEGPGAGTCAVAASYHPRHAVLPQLPMYCLLSPRCRFAGERASSLDAFKQNCSAASLDVFLNRTLPPFFRRFKGEYASSLDVFKQNLAAHGVAAHLDEGRLVILQV